jgi:hypothetical protein
MLYFSSLKIRHRVGINKKLCSQMSSMFSKTNVFLYPSLQQLHYCTKINLARLNFILQVFLYSFITTTLKLYY